VERLVAQLRAGVALTGVTAAEQLGCSPRTGRRLLRQAEEHLGSTAATAAPSAEDAGRGDVRTATQDGMSADQGQAV
jgi:hypothetical protein